MGATARGWAVRGGRPGHEDTDSLGEPSRGQLRGQRLASLLTGRQLSGPPGQQSVDVRALRGCFETLFLQHVSFTL